MKKKESGGGGVVGVERRLRLRRRVRRWKRQGSIMDLPFPGQLFSVGNCKSNFISGSVRDSEQGLNLKGGRLTRLRLEHVHRCAWRMDRRGRGTTMQYSDDHVSRF